MAARISTTMPVVLMNKTGDTDVLEYRTDIPVPKPSADDILVKNEYIGINFIDIYFRTGLYPSPHLPLILGREASGTVAAIGSDNPHNLSVGDRVAYFDQLGAYAGYTAVPASRILPVPKGVSAIDAAAAPLQALTAWTMLLESHEVKPGEIILITAAAGGVGQWLVQMAKVIGATVIATCSTGKVDLVKSLGADHVINYVKDEDYAPKVLEITGGQGVHAVFDSVGKSTFESSLKCVRRKGTFVSFGNASGAVPPFSILRLGEKNVKIVRPKLDPYLVTGEELESNAKAVWDFILSGKVKVQIHETYPLRDAARAHEDLAGRKTTGKLLLQPDEKDIAATL